MTGELFLGETDGDIESYLVDLNSVPLAKLRVMGGTTFNTAIERVVDQAGKPLFAKGGSCSQADFD